MSLKFTSTRNCLQSTMLYLLTQVQIHRRGSIHVTYFGLLLGNRITCLVALTIYAGITKSGANVPWTCCTYMFSSKSEYMWDGHYLARPVAEICLSNLGVGSFGDGTYNDPFKFSIRTN